MSARVNNLLYAAGTDLLGTIRICVTMSEAVQPQALRSALARSAVRFPYYAVRLEKLGETYVFEPNTLPFSISPQGRTVTLGTEESNFHLFAFAYDGRQLYMDATHFVTDGNGMFPFLKTTLYYYLSELHPDAGFDTTTIALAGDPVPAEESDDYPYPCSPLPAEPLGRMARPEKVFQLPGQPQGYGGMDTWTSFRYTIPQNELMAYVSSVDGSPATFIASLMYKAIADSHPENRLPIVCGMQHQFRSALGRPLSHLCHVNIVPLVYPDRLRTRDVERLNTIARGSLILHADDDHDILTVNEHVRNEAEIQGMTLIQKREHMRSVIFRGIGKNTFEVSYTGRVPWSGLDRYVESVDPYFDLTLSGGLSVEIFSVNGVFSINVMQRSGETRYTERFAALLKENGVTFSAMPPEHFSLCGFRLPGTEMHDQSASRPEA